MPAAAGRGLCLWAFVASRHTCALSAVARLAPARALPSQGDALGRGQLHLHPAWVQLRAADGQLLYLHRLRPHVASPNFYAAPVGGTCGGFL